MATRTEVNLIIASQKAEGSEVRLHEKAITSNRPNVFTLVCRHPEFQETVMLEVEGHTILVVQPNMEDKVTANDVEELWRTGKVV